MAKLIFRNPLVLKNGTGFSVSTNNEELNALTASVVTFSIPQELSTSSSVVFNSINTSDKVNIDNGSLILTNSGITGSFTQVGNQGITSDITVTGNVTVKGILTAETITSEVSQSVTLFKSGSTQFGDTSDDTHQRTGSLSMSGSTIGLNNFDVTEISNDTTLADEGTTNIVTENAVKTYLDNQTDDFQTYQRKSFAHTGSFVSVSTASFTAISASAPTGYTATSEADFMFFVNGAIAEYDALTIQQTGTSFLLKVNNNSIGYDLQSSDEIVAFGKFNS